MDGLLGLVARERAGESVDRTRLKSLLRMFNNMGVYGELFERPFLAHTTSFYQVLCVCVCVFVCVCGRLGDRNLPTGELMV